MTIIKIESSEAFEQWLVKSGVCVVHFCASWSEACKQMREVAVELSNLSDSSSIAFGEIEAESVPDVSQKYNISAVPTFIFFRNHKECDRLEGAYPNDLTKRVRQLAGYAQSVLPLHGSSGSAQSASKEDLNGRCHSLINSYPCMVFIKGTSDSPQCGFTRQLVSLLSDNNVDFKSFNILSDEEVRQGLKEYSNWPTYPQVYINGEFIGGLDIVKELIETGELAEKLPKRLSLDDRLKQLINRSPVMVFMKGRPGAPQCGFSRTLCQILDETKIVFDSFNILEDEEVRQGLKIYSNWPTYPQVYANGNLIGGVDIIKELKENGELESQLKPQST